MFLTLNMEFILSYFQSCFALVKKIKFSLTREINSIFNVKLLNILYIFFRERDMCKKAIKPRYKCSTHGSFREYSDYLSQLKNWCLLWSILAILPLTISLNLMGVQYNLIRFQAPTRETDMHFYNLIYTGMQRTHSLYTDILDLHVRKWLYIYNSFFFPAEFRLGLLIYGHPDWFRCGSNHALHVLGKTHRKWYDCWSSFRYVFGADHMVVRSSH